ncbi:RNA-binding protein Nova-1-like [Lingula anatina]|uniref:RNA-binding protein Nova-1-like n=1 Tax=Lingula anatina TaxID=7574 RepID=A0A1S3I6P6_LINAN|nr:RNA-binding protein Nova-1-like [Lingula anatina]|eukprot:XP_013393521.1 RNA-binding protein Nova-1-like [Lingula anatina]
MMNSDVDPTSDSRKRPLDGEMDSGNSKRSNQGAADNVQLKVLVPSIAAGAIIGKGGETIAQLQKETGARIKMSKANDFYPGTCERVCLMTGNLESVLNVNSFVMDKIREKPDPNPKPVDGEVKVNLERHKQVKILVPNSTAGMIIGKGGVYIRQIKEESGAYVQISQKSKEMNLPERCITVAGEADNDKAAVKMILQKISEDPQSGSCPNISYADISGPVASSNPTGSPFAHGQSGSRSPASLLNGSNIGQSLNNLNLGGGGPSSNGSGGVGNGTVGGPGGTGGNMAVENLRAALRGSGYSDQAADEIIAALTTLANYGLLGMGLGLGGLANLASLTQNLGGLMNASTPGNVSNGAFASGSGAGGGVANPGMNSANSLLGMPNNGQQAGSGGSNVFGPVGQATAGLINSGNNTSGMYGNSSGFGAETLFSDSYGGNGMNGGAFGAGNYAGGMAAGAAGEKKHVMGGQNQNSFGLGTGIGSFVGGEGGGAGDADGTKKELEVADTLVGVILGPGGRGITELQQFTGANIQISKKGVFTPGTRNRIVSVTGNPSNVSRAALIIQQRISQEEVKRARQSGMQ